MGISDQGPREAKPRRSRSHSRTKALELRPERSFGIQSSSRNLGHKSSEFILELSTIKSDLSLCLSTYFSLNNSMISPHISSTNSRKGITLAYQIIILYVWIIFFLPCHVRGQWSSYSIFARPFSAKDNWWDNPQGGCSDDRLSKGNL